MKVRSLLPPSAVLLGVALLLGCGSQAPGGAAARPPTSSPTSAGLTDAPDKPVGTFVLPPRKRAPIRPGDFTPKVVWKQDMLLVTAFGSSTCRPVADEAVAADQHTIVVTFRHPAAGVACTDDYGPTRSRIPAPAGDIALDSDVYAAFDLEGTAPRLIPVRLVNPVLN